MPEDEEPTDDDETEEPSDATNNDDDAEAQDAGEAGEEFSPQAEGQVDLSGKKPPVEVEYETQIKHKFQTPKFRFYPTDTDLKELHAMPKGEALDHVDGAMRTKPETKLVSPDERMRHINALLKEAKKTPAVDWDT